MSRNKSYLTLTLAMDCFNRKQATSPALRKAGYKNRMASGNSDRAADRQRGIQAWKTAAMRKSATHDIPDRREPAGPCKTILLIDWFRHTAAWPGGHSMQRGTHPPFLNPPDMRNVSLRANPSGKRHEQSTGLFITRRSRSIRFQKGRKIMTETNGNCAQCRKKTYCKKQCRANREYLEKQVRLHIAQYLAKKLLTKKEIRNGD